MIVEEMLDWDLPERRPFPKAPKMSQLKASLKEGEWIAKKYWHGTADANKAARILEQPNVPNMTCILRPAANYDITKVCAVSYKQKGIIRKVLRLF